MPHGCSRPVTTGTSRNVACSELIASSDAWATVSWEHPTRTTAVPAAPRAARSVALVDRMPSLRHVVPSDRWGDWSMRPSRNVETTDHTAWVFIPALGEGATPVI